MEVLLVVSLAVLMIAIPVWALQNKSRRMKIRNGSFAFYLLRFVIAAVKIASSHGSETRMQRIVAECPLPRVNVFLPAFLPFFGCNFGKAKDYLAISRSTCSRHYPILL